MFLIGIIDPVITGQINRPAHKSNLTDFATWSADQMWSGVRRGHETVQIWWKSVIFFQICVHLEMYLLAQRALRHDFYIVKIPFHAITVHIGGSCT